VVPVYNHEDYIASTLESLLTQRCDFDYRILIGDDCSSDGSLKIAKDYERRFPATIKVLAAAVNVGLMRNLFDGLFDCVNSKYVAICAGDDKWIDVNKLQAQVDILEARDDVSLVHTGYVKCFEKTGEIEEINSWRFRQNHDDPIGNMISVIFEEFSSFPLASSVVFRGSVLVQNAHLLPRLIHDKNTPGEGLILYSLSAKAGLLFFLDEIMVQYRVRADSLSHFTNATRKVSFDFKFRLYHKSELVKQLVDRPDLCFRVNRSLLSVLYLSIRLNAFRSFMNLYSDYQKDNGEYIKPYLSILIFLLDKKLLHQRLCGLALMGLYGLKNTILWLIIRIRDNSQAWYT